MPAEYFSSWLLYLAAVAGSCLVFWQLLTVCRLISSRWVLTLLLAVLLLVPVRIEAGSSFWAPAFMAALLDSLSQGGEAAMDRIWPMIWALLLAPLFIAPLWFGLQRRKQKAKE